MAETAPSRPPVSSRRTGGPLVFAHRGASADEPEHTLSAYQRALKDGADGLECDVRLTADSHLVCVHDRRVDRTSTGRGVVSTLELAELEGLDWGSWKALEARSRAELGETATGEEVVQDRSRLLTLNRLLATLVECDREVGLLVETKHPTRYAGLVERELARVLREHGLDGAPRAGEPWVQMMSFSVLAVQRMRQLCPAIPAVLLMKENVPLRFRDGSLPRGVTTVGLDRAIVLRWPDTVRRQQQRGHRVYVWTVDDLEEARLFADLGVDALISNRPRDVMDAVDSRG